jgi:hypothetical protein
MYPATDSDFIPATVPISFRPPLAVSLRVSVVDVCFFLVRVNLGF